MKIVLSIVAGCLFTIPSHAHNCSFYYDGTNYNLGFITGTNSTSPLQVGETDIDSLPYKRFEKGHVVTKFAAVHYEIKKLVALDQTIGNCADRPTGAPTWATFDKRVVATQITISSEAPVFGSPTDGPGRKALKLWGVCYEDLVRDCP